jgi:polyisoprenoid-binding protein YceI
MTATIADSATPAMQGRAPTALPAPGTFIIDPAHTYVGFIARHLMVAKVRGQFTAFTGSITVAENQAVPRVEVVIQSASITTHNDQRDAHLRSADFMDADRYPTMTFRSTAVAAGVQPGFRLLGELSIKECTRPIQMDVELCGVATDPWGQQRIALTATAEIDREEFGVTFNAPLEGGGFLISRTIRIEIDAEAIREA